MGRKFRWKRRRSASPRTKLRTWNESGSFETWRKTIDEASCAIVCSSSLDSDAGGMRAETARTGAGDERAVPFEFDGSKTEQPHRMDPESRGPAEYLGGRRPAVHGEADYQIQQG